MHTQNCEFQLLGDVGSFGLPETTETRTISVYKGFTVHHSLTILKHLWSAKYHKTTSITLTQPPKNGG